DAPAEVSKIADRFFNDLPVGQRVSALSILVELLLLAKEPVSNAPLLSARYHLFLKSLEGAFVSYWPQKRVLLDRGIEGERSTSFEIALCRECGQHYLVGKINNNRLVEAIRDPGHPDFGATFFRPIEDEQVVDEGEDNNAKQVYRLCILCGGICQANKQLQCKHRGSILVERQSGAEEREDQIPRCSVCGYQSPDPVREVVHGTDGPHAVIATTLYQNLPERRKKVLAFADGRQEAAFFAWYLEHSYKDILRRNLLLKVIQRLSAYAADGISLRTISLNLRDIYQERKVFPPTMDDLELRREAWLGLYREFLTDEPRISLEGVGLVRWSIEWPQWFRIPEILRIPPWSLTKEEARDLISVLLDSMRVDRAVELQTDKAVSLQWSDLELQASQLRFRIGAPKTQKGVRSWDGKTGKRAIFMAKLLMKKGFGKQEALEQAVNALRAIWETVRKCDENASSSYNRLLIPIDDARRLNPEWWRVHATSEDDVIFKCTTCGRLQTISVHGLCSRHRCPGILKEIRLNDLEPNHYRLLYEADLPGSLRVEEHTAQLDKEKAREFQREFREGKINVLSCSTTFELGVDLGDLDTIFLRNVPPEAFNYAQRVGRAGRRNSYPGFAITYC
ncbi:MAG: helicase-related protein, partial [Thermodesulfobacteriota bacterium]